MGALDLKKQEARENSMFLAKILTDVGALDFKRKKHQLLMILSNTSYFTIEIHFCLFSWSSWLKNAFSLKLLLFFTRNHGS